MAAYPYCLGPKQFLSSKSAMESASSPEQANLYTRWLATHRYENFHVVSVLLPRGLRQDFYNVYAYCRWADDLGDEIGDTHKSLELLSWWRGELEALYRGDAPHHPVFVALKETIERHDLPIEPFDHLIQAFEQDQVVTRYADWPSVYLYCVHSANPVGRLVLMLCGYRDQERFHLSDATCTALQLANFWQDVTVDLEKGRVYLPQHLFSRYGYTEQDLACRRFTTAFREIMRESVDEAQRLFETGLALPRMVAGRLALDLDLFSRGGMKVLDKIRAQGYDVLRARPSVNRVERAVLLLRSLAGVAFRGAA